MIIISGITISNPSGNLNSVIVEILNSGSTVIATIPYSGQSTITYNEPGDGIYYVRINDGTSTYTCELTKDVYSGNYIFNIGSGFNNYIMTLIQNNDGKYVVGGDFTTYSGVTSNYMVVLNVDGSISHNYNFNLYVNEIIQDSDDKYVIIGEFTTYSGITANYIIRLNNDGTIDNTFNSGVGFNSTTWSIIQDSNGKYLVGGNFTTYSGVTANYIIRLNNDGTIDNTFNSGAGFNGSPGANSIIQDSNGKYLIGGVFTTYSGISKNYIVRLNYNGTIDNTFNSGGGFDSPPFKIIQDSNGKYLIGGDFTSYSGVTRNKIVRLNNNGSIDNTFNLGIGFNYNVRAILEDVNNKYLVGGSFTTYSGVTANRIIRLNNDGTIDNTFNSGVGFNSPPLKIIQDLNGKYLIGGYFTTYNGSTSNYIIRLNQDGTIN